MRVLDWSDAKNAANLRKHKVNFDSAERFDWKGAEIEIDDREDYGELRQIATGHTGDVPYVLVFTERGDVTWIISLRKASKKEREHYGR